jgi:hypothetical protein
MEGDRRMTEPDDKRYDETSFRKIAELLAGMYMTLVKEGVPRKHATRIVCTWIAEMIPRAGKGDFG